MRCVKHEAWNADLANTYEIMAGRNYRIRLSEDLDIDKHDGSGFEGIMCEM
jgi:hypothetical protein